MHYELLVRGQCISCWLSCFVLCEYLVFFFFNGSVNILL